MVIVGSQMVVPVSSPFLSPPSPLPPSLPLCLSCGCGRFRACRGTHLTLRGCRHSGLAVKLVARAPHAGLKVSERGDRYGFLFSLLLPLPCGV